jgi:hypothetical protein
LWIGHRIIAYDDSDGWYDHLTDLINGSATAADSLNGAGVCISTTAAAAALPGVTGTAPAQGRCGHGPRMPLLVISPWANKNYVDATAGTLNNMFNFTNGAVVPNPNVVLLNPPLVRALLIRWCGEWRGSRKRRARWTALLRGTGGCRGRRCGGGGSDRRSG